MTIFSGGGPPPPPLAELDDMVADILGYKHVTIGGCYTKQQFFSFEDEPSGCAHKNLL